MTNASRDSQKPARLITTELAGHCRQKSDSVSPTCFVYPTEVGSCNWEMSFTIRFIATSLIVTTCWVRATPTPPCAPLSVVTVLLSIAVSCNDKGVRIYVRELLILASPIYRLKQLQIVCEQNASRQQLVLLRWCPFDSMANASIWYWHQPTTKHLYFVDDMLLSDPLIQSVLTQRNRELDRWNVWIVQCRNYLYSIIETNKKQYYVQILFALHLTNKLSRFLPFATWGRSDLSNCVDMILLLDNPILRPL